MKETFKIADIINDSLEIKDTKRYLRLEEKRMREIGSEAERLANEFMNRVEALAEYPLHELFDKRIEELKYVAEAVAMPINFIRKVMGEIELQTPDEVFYLVTATEQVFNIYVNQQMNVKVQKAAYKYLESMRDKYYTEQDKNNDPYYHGYKKNNPPDSSATFVN